MAGLSRPARLSRWRAMATRHAGMVHRPAWKSARPARTRSSPGSPADQSFFFIKVRLRLAEFDHRESMHVSNLVGSSWPQGFGGRISHRIQSDMDYSESVDVSNLVGSSWPQGFGGRISHRIQSDIDYSESVDVSHLVGRTPLLVVRHPPIGQGKHGRKFGHIKFVVHFPFAYLAPVVL